MAWNAATIARLEALGYEQLPIVDGVDPSNYNFRDYDILPISGNPGLSYPIVHHAILQNGGWGNTLPAPTGSVEIYGVDYNSWGIGYWDNTYTGDTNAVLIFDDSVTLSYLQSYNATLQYPGIIHLAYYGIARPASLSYNGSKTGPFTDVIGNKFVVTPEARTGKTLSSIDWSIQNTSHGIADVYTSQTVTKANGFVNTPFGTNGVLNGASSSAIGPYWGPYGGQQVILATFHYSDSTTDQVSATVDVVVPTGSIDTVSLGTPTILTDPNGNKVLSSGEDVNLAPAYTWHASVNSSTTDGKGGNIGVVQTINVFHKQLIHSNLILGNWKYLIGYDSQGISHFPLLDDLVEINSVFYAGIIKTISENYQTSDTPSMGSNAAGFISPGFIRMIAYQEFVQTLMYQPTGGANGNGIYVPLGKLRWRWGGFWWYKTPDTIIAPTKPEVMIPYSNTVEYPKWVAPSTSYGIYEKKL